MFTDIGIAHPIGRGNDAFIPLLHQYAYHIEDRMFSADIDGAFLRFVARTQLAFVPSADRLAQWHDPAGRRVLGVVLLNGVDGGLLDVIRSGAVRVALAGVRNV